MSAADTAATTAGSVDPIVAELLADAMDRVALLLTAETDGVSELAQQIQRAANTSRAMAGDAVALAALERDGGRTADEVKEKLQHTRGFGAAVEATPQARQDFIDSLTREELDVAPKLYRAYVAGYFAGTRCAEEHGLDE